MKRLPSSTSTHAGRRPARRVRSGRFSRARGFTLIELTVVVIIVGVFAAMAIPEVTLQMRDRRVHEAAQRIVLVYQQARMRALGQGGAVMVHYTGAGQGAFETRDALVGAVDLNEKCQSMPSVSCTQTNWTDTTKKQFRSIETLALVAEPGLSDSSSAPGVFSFLTTDTGTAGTDMDVCFTPIGRTFIRYKDTDPWTTTQGIPQISVARKSGADYFGLIRKVLILPTGIARLQL